MNIRKYEWIKNVEIHHFFWNLKKKKKPLRECVEILEKNLEKCGTDKRWIKFIVSTIIKYEDYDEYCKFLDEEVAPLYVRRDPILDKYRE